MNCKKCNEPLEEHWDICPACGDKIEIILHCPNCQREVREHWKICPNCKTSLPQSTATEVEESRTKLLSDIRSPDKEVSTKAFEKVEKMVDLRILISDVTDLTIDKLQKLLFNLDSPEDIQRMEASEAIDEMLKPEAVKTLIALLDDQDINFMNNAQELLAVIIDTLTETRNDDALYVLSELMVNCETFVSGAAWKALEKIGTAESYKYFLLNMMGSEKDTEEIASISQKYDEPSLEALIQLLSDEDENIQRIAAKVSGHIGARMIAHLFRIIKGTDDHPKEFAIIALLTIWSDRNFYQTRYESAIELFEQSIEAIQKEPENTQRRFLNSFIKALEWEDYCGSVVSFLTEFGDHGIDTITLALNDENAMKWEIFDGLSQIKTTEAIKLHLEFLIDKDENIRLKIMGYLADLKDEKYFEYFIRALKDESSSVRATAAEALGSFKDNRAIQPLIEAIIDGTHNENLWIMEEAMKAITEIDEEQVVPALEKLLEEEENEYIRSILEGSIEDIKDE